MTLRTRSTRNQFLPFNDRGHAHAAADTQGGQTDVKVAADHFIHQGDDDPNTGGPHGMAKPDTAAVDVGDLPV